MTLVLCCMCNNDYDIFNTFIPSICFQKNMNKSHRICSQCWWNSDIGFARENACHKCPGCVYELPLTNVLYNVNEVVDLTEN